MPPNHSPFAIHRSPAAALGGGRCLRDIHAACDWTDLSPQCRCEFLLGYEEGEEEASGEQREARGEGARRKRKKPWRYRWPDEIRDEVLARLLKLNAERAEEERLAGLAAAVSASPTATPKNKRSRKPMKGSRRTPDQPSLFT